MTKRSIVVLLALAVCASLIAVPASTAGGGLALTVSKAGKGDGNVTSNPAGIDCGSDCQESFSGGTMVTLTATPNATSSFVGWKGDCSGSGSCTVTMNAAHSVRAVFARAYRPDAWIKLCGLSTGCTINPPPHPWHGNNRYNSTAKKQTVSVRMEDGEGVRFWLILENDGVVNAVVAGFQKRPRFGPAIYTTEFKNGTLTFPFPASKPNKQVKLTVNIVAPTTAEGVTYRCPITISSEHQPTAKDTIAGRMTTY
jgi:Divergent InlB B-repeat domain